MPSQRELGTSQKIALALVGSIVDETFERIGHNIERRHLAKDSQATIDGSRARRAVQSIEDGERSLSAPKALIAPQP